MSCDASNKLLRLPPRALNASSRRATSFESYLTLQAAIKVPPFPGGNVATDKLALPVNGASSSGFPMKQFPVSGDDHDSSSLPQHGDITASVLGRAMDIADEVESAMMSYKKRRKSDCTEKRENAAAAQNPIAVEPSSHSQSQHVVDKK